MHLSIITPSYGQPDWLRLCVASVADQVAAAAGAMTVEHIIQDGGTPGIETLPLPADARLFVEKDVGMYDAINRGLEKSTGEICAYLNCDEQYLPGALGKVAEWFALHPEKEVLFGDALLVASTGKPLSYRQVMPPSRWHTRLVHLATLSCAMFFRRSCFEEGIRFPVNYRMIGDAVFVHELLARGKRVGVLNEALAAFTFTGENLGASEAARAESAGWRNEVPFPLNKTGPLLSIHHRIRKLLAGAYQARTFDYRLFTSDSHEARRDFHATQLSWKWPSDFQEVKS